jgi:hypothetical protein
MAPVATLGRWQVGLATVATVGRLHLPIATVNSRKRTFHGNFFIIFRRSRKLKRLIVEDKIIPGIVLPSSVDYCSFRTVRIFNIISLHFVERCGTKLATLHCYVGSLASGPGHSSNGQMTLACCYYFPQQQWSW